MIVSRHLTKSRLIKPDIKEVIASIEKGHRISIVAHDFGIDRATVVRIRKREADRRRALGQSTEMLYHTGPTHSQLVAFRRSRRTDRDAGIEALLDKWWSIQAIANSFGVSIGTVYRLRTARINRQRPGGPSAAARPDFGDPEF